MGNDKVSLEGMMRLILATFIVIFSIHTYGKTQIKKIEKLMYFNKTYGHIYKKPSHASQSFSTISCGHPIKVMSINGQVDWGKGFYFVKAGPYEGYIKMESLSKRESSCIQDKYPRFFNALNLSVSDMYYWGKLQDQFDRGESQVK